MRAFPRTRIVLAGDRGVHPMLAVKPSRDGGLMIDLGKSAPCEHYRYGVVDVPPGEGSWDAPIRPEEANWSVRRTPKMHYHRSGFLTLNATEHLDRQGILATPAADLGPGHEHCFTFIARHPYAWQEVAQRQSDLVFNASKPPTTVTFAGFIGPAANLKQRALGKNPLDTLVEHEDGSVVPTVIGTVEVDDLAYYLWIEVHMQRPFGEGDDPQLILYGFDPRKAKDTTLPTEMVGVWSVTEAEAEAG